MKVIVGNILPDMDKHFPILGKAKTLAIYPTIGSGIIMAIAGMGDALLYIHLPVNGTSLGLQAVIIGVLLSINKFIRFFTNGWVAHFAFKWGVKNMLKVGVVIAAITTALYALNPTIWVWIIARVFWGFSYSALRFSTIQYASSYKTPGKALGLAKSIQEMGPVIVYLLGPLMINTFESQNTFLVLSLCNFIALPLFIGIPKLNIPPQKISKFKVQWPDFKNTWILISSFTIEGLLIVGISVLLNLNDVTTSSLLISAGLYISIRRILNILVAPVSGWCSDRLGFRHTYNASCFLIICGVLLIAFKFPIIGLLVAFLGAAVNNTLNPLFAVFYAKKEHNFSALTSITTSRDMGSAVGALTGLYILSTVDPALIFGIIGLFMIIIWYNLNKFVKNYERTI